MVLKVVVNVGRVLGEDEYVDTERSYLIYEKQL